MKYCTLFFCTFLILFNKTAAQTTTTSKADYKYSKSFGLQGSLYLLEHPLGFYPGVTLSYSKNIVGNKRHQLAIFPQIGLLILPDVESRYIFTAALQYKYISKKRFEGNIFIGASYILTRLAFDRYEYENATLKNKGNLLHHAGPSAGFNLGYKVIKKKKYSISKQIGISFTKFNKSYTPSLFSGYKPAVNIGIILNK
ncbi:hypothetical protein [Ferruginibacter sp.]